MGYPLPTVRRVEATIDLSVPSARAIGAFLDPAALASWWRVERSLIEPRPGGLFAVTWAVKPTGFGYMTTGVIGALDPERSLRIDHYTYFHPERPILGPMTLTVDARDGGSGCRLTVVQDGYRDGEHWDWYHAAVEGAWPRVLEDIKRHLET